MRPSSVVLVSMFHAKQKAGNHGHDHQEHGALQVEPSRVRAAVRHVPRGKGKRFKESNTTQKRDRLPPSLK